MGGAAQGIGVVQPAIRPARRVRQHVAGNLQRRVPFPRLNVHRPAQIQHGGVSLVRRRNRVQLRPRIGARSKSEPALGSLEVMNVGWFESPHDDRINPDPGNRNVL